MADEQGNGQTNPGQDGLAREGGQVTGLTYLGKFYELDGMRDEDFQEIEQYLLGRRKNPLLAIKEQLRDVRDNPRLEQMLVDRAYQDMRKDADIDQVSHQEVRDYLDTRNGTIHSLWLMLRRKYPEVTQEMTREMFQHVSTAEALKRRDEASARTMASRSPRAFGEEARA